jgi:pimeloyl-ACP methyl ester carboxylesterase
VGPSGGPARAVHDRVAAAVYGGVRAALRAVPRGAGAVLAARAAQDAPALADSPRGALALAVLNGYAGDALEADGSALALGMTVRCRGAHVEANAPAVPAATGRIAIFVHGLGETDAAWRLRATPEQPGYGARLERELGYTPLELRYNTGRRIAENGRALAALLEELYDAWPPPVEDIVLVGHSMGGLVARSACNYGHAGGQGWTRAVSHVICLGSPHLGAPLEKGVHALGWALGRVPETRPFARPVDARSAGIKDLRDGTCVEDDVDPTAKLCFIAATVGREPLGTLVGDLIVRVPSASGAGCRRRIAFADGRRIDGLNHIDLLNHPAVYEQIRAWLAP